MASPTPPARKAAAKLPATPPARKAATPPARPPVKPAKPAKTTSLPQSTVAAKTRQMSGGPARPGAMTRRVMVQGPRAGGGFDPGAFVGQVATNFGRGVDVAAGAVGRTIGSLPRVPEIPNREKLTGGWAPGGGLLNPKRRKP